MNASRLRYQAHWSRSAQRSSFASSRLCAATASRARAAQALRRPRRDDGVPARAPPRRARARRPQAAEVAADGPRDGPRRRARAQERPPREEHVRRGLDADRGVAEARVAPADGPHAVERDEDRRRAQREEVVAAPLVAALARLDDRRGEPHLAPLGADAVVEAERAVRGGARLAERDGGERVERVRVVRGDEARALAARGGSTSARGARRPRARRRWPSPSARPTCGGTAAPRRRHRARKRPSFCAPACRAYATRALGAPQLEARDAPERERRRPLRALELLDPAPQRRPQPVAHGRGGRRRRRAAAEGAREQPQRQRAELRVDARVRLDAVRRRRLGLGAQHDVARRRDARHRRVVVRRPRSTGPCWTIAPSARRATRPWPRRRRAAACASPPCAPRAPRRPPAGTPAARRRPRARAARASAAATRATARRSSSPPS